MIQRLIIQPHLCTGCRSCELACAFTHGQNGLPGPSRCQTMAVGPSAFVPMMCLQCEHAACVRSCPVDAIQMNPRTRVVEVDRERCVGCQACVVACPFGNMHFDSVQHVAHKCDLCAGHGNTPRCALFCPTKCLSVDNDSELVRKDATQSSVQAAGCGLDP